jgi:aspartate carbamoyltransferase catalytic subunit
MSAFNTCYKWAEENNMQAEDILIMYRLQKEKVLMRHLETKGKKLLTLSL